MKKTVLITGCSSGFGKLTVKKFLQEGWNVIATMRTPEKEQELTQLENVFVTKLDVTDKESVKEAVILGIEKFGNIDVLVNNAGYGGHAYLEQVTEEQIHTMFETNVFGIMRVSKEVLPYMRKKREGTIVNVTSMSGYMGLPLATTYSASKYAAQGLSESLAMEYKPFGIKVKTVAPGAYGTNFFAATDNSLDNGDEELQTNAQKMVAHFAAVAERMRQQGGAESDPQEVANKIFECATGDTPVHNIVGADAEMLMGMIKSMSRQDFIKRIEEMLIPKED